VQAKDIADRTILGIIDSLDDGSHWVGKHDIYARLGEPPAKVFFAKLVKIERRGMAEGCALDWCGCTGWSLTDEGRAFLAVTEKEGE